MCSSMQSFRWFDGFCVASVLSDELWESTACSPEKYRKCIKLKIYIYNKMLQPEQMFAAGGCNSNKKRTFVSFYLPF